MNGPEEGGAKKVTKKILKIQKTWQPGITGSFIRTGETTCKIFSENASEEFGSHS